MATENTYWSKLNGALEDIMRARLSRIIDPKTTRPVNNVGLIKLFKEKGQTESDEYVADMAICARRVMKDELGINVEVYEEEEYTPLTDDDDEEDAEEMLDAIILANPKVIEMCLTELKHFFRDEYSDEFTNQQMILDTIAYFNDKERCSLQSQNDLLDHINLMGEDDMVNFLYYVYKSGSYSSADVDDILLQHI